MAGSIEDLNRLLLERSLLERAKEDDRLVLDDAALGALLEGSRALTSAEWDALIDSPLTLRRFRRLARAKRSGVRRSAGNDTQWSDSEGLLLAADAGAELSVVHTEDGLWSLHFLPRGEGWQVVVKRSPIAPASAPLLVVDGEGYPIAEGTLDDDGELEAQWPFPDAPAVHFRHCGGRFAVKFRR